MKVLLWCLGGLTFMPVAYCQTAPTFVTQPTSQSTTVGGSITVNVSVDTSSVTQLVDIGFGIQVPMSVPASVSWQASLGGRVISPNGTATSQSNNRISASLSFGPISPGDAGQLSIIATNVYGSTSSIPVSLTITDSYALWAQRNFTAEELGLAAVSGPQAIVGANSMANVVKYALGLTAKSNATTGLPTLTNNGANWVFSFTKPTSVTDATCTVETSADLSTWTATGLTQTLLSTSGGVDSWQATLPVAATGNAFFRLRVSVP